MKRLEGAIYAAYKGHTEIVSMLLADQRCAVNIKTHVTIYIIRYRDIVIGCFHRQSVALRYIRLLAMDTEMSLIF